MQIVYLLFEDIKYRQEDNKYKPLHEIQKLVAERFKEITGLTAPHSDFLSVSRTFVNILNIKEKTQRHTLKKKNIAIARSEILLIISSRTSSCAHVPSITISCSVLANICNTNIHSTESRFVYTQLIFSSSIIIGLQASKGSETTKAKWPGFSTNTLL